MDFDDYKLICFIRGIDPNIIEISRKFIIEHNYLFDFGKQKTVSANNDLGYSELKKITSREQSLRVVEQSIRDCILEYDKLGRNMAKVKTRKLIKNNGDKFINRIILKSYYLHYYDL